MGTSRFLLVVVAASLLLNGVVCGKEAQQSVATKTEEDKAAINIKNVDSITVAIIDFESQTPGNPELGQQLGDILTARLSIYDKFRLVERKKLQDLLAEQQLNLSGMVDTNQVTKVGKMLGARIMIFGRAFAVDRDIYIVAKIVGTETSQVKGVIAKGKLESNLSDIIDQLVEKLTEGLEKWAPLLLPSTERFQNKVKMLKQRLKGKQLPAVAIMISEVHMSRRVADPAAETEVKKIFKEVGFNLIEAKSKTAKELAGEIQLADADIIVTGEGFSDFGARVGGLVSCIARLEVQATHKVSRRIIASERTTRRALDLSEAIAGKTALQAAGHELAIKLVEKIAQDIEDQPG